MPLGAASRLADVICAGRWQRQRERVAGESRRGPEGDGSLQDGGRSSEPWVLPVSLSHLSLFASFLLSKRTPGTG